jgi:GDP-D-mannose dehydratase
VEASWGHLAEVLLSHGCQVAGVVRRDSQHLRGLTGRLKIFTYDVTDRPSLTRVISDVEPRFVFHLAAEDVIPRSWEDPKATVETNVIGTLSVLDGVRDAAPDAMVQVAGSASEYGPRRPREYLFARRRCRIPRVPTRSAKRRRSSWLYFMRPGTRCVCTAFVRFSSSGLGSFLT